MEREIYLFTVPGEVVLREREGSSDYVYKCFEHGFEKIEYAKVCEDLLRVCPKASICYYYRTGMFDSCRGGEEVACRRGAGEQPGGAEQADEWGRAGSVTGRAAASVDGREADRARLGVERAAALRGAGEVRAADGVGDEGACECSDAAVVKQWKEDMGYAAVAETMREGLEKYGGEVCVGGEREG